MTTELEQEFFRVFGIEKTSFDFICNKNKCNKKRLFGRFSCLECDNETKKEIKVYSEITAEKLLEMICIYNEFQNNCDNSFIPTSISNLKGNFLAVIIQAIKDEIANRYFCNDVGKLKQQIQQLFKNEQ